MIRKLLKYFKSHAIDYAIISGYEDLLNKKNNNRDVDILFRKKDFLNIEKSLTNFCELKGYHIVQIYHQEVYAKNIFIFNPKNSKLLNLDLYGKLHRKHTNFFSEDQLFERRTSFKNISILAPDHEFIHYLFKKIDKNEITKDTFNYLSHLYHSSKINCNVHLHENFIKLSQLIVKAFETQNKSLIVKNIEALKKDIKVDAKFCLSDFVSNKLRILKRITRPTGITISFLGPDGSGKSTIINGLKNKTLPFRATSYFHLKPLFPKALNLNSETTTDPHKHLPYSKLKSYIKLLFFIYQYGIGWLKNIVALKIKSTLVIFDRYYDDLIVDHKRYRYGGSKKIAKWVCTFIPKPKLYFILIADANIIYHRKQEVEYFELQHQIEGYKSLSLKKRYHLIDVNRPVESIVNEVLTILMKKMNERY